MNEFKLLNSVFCVHPEMYVESNFPSAEIIRRTVCPYSGSCQGNVRIHLPKEGNRFCWNNSETIRCYHKFSQDARHFEDTDNVIEGREQNYSEDYTLCDDYDSHEEIRHVNVEETQLYMSEQESDEEHTENMERQIELEDEKDIIKNKLEELGLDMECSLSTGEYLRKVYGYSLK